MFSSYKDLIIIIVIIVVAPVSLSLQQWNLTEIGLPGNVLIWKLAVWRTRAFLSIPRWRNNVMKYTLIEAPWPEIGNNVPFVTPQLLELTPFPNATAQLLHNNEPGTCDNLISVTGLDIDSKGRLWVLDSSNDLECPAKIVFYDLRKNNEITRTDLTGINKKQLQTLVVDPVSGSTGTRGYIGDAGDDMIIIYNLGQRRWWKLKLQLNSSLKDQSGLVQKLYATDIAVCRKNSLLYVTGYETDDLFSINLDTLRADEGPPPILRDEETQNTTVSWVGKKMGRSSGLICDSKGGVHYFMVSERASVRWDTKLELKAESHSILLQTEDVPCVTDYVLDPQKNVWALVNSEYPHFGSADEKKGDKVSLSTGDLKFRTAKVYKYNPFAL